MSESKKEIPGILLIYHCPIVKTPYLIQEHIDAFKGCSQFEVRTINTVFGFPDGLEDFEFQVIILSYTLFAWKPFFIDKGFRDYIEHSSAFKVAFFQDEYRFWPERSEFINSCKIDLVYTNLEPPYFAETYGKLTSAKQIKYYLSGYVSSRLIEDGLSLFKPDSDRPVDIGYRGRQSYHYMGKGAKEKTIIGDQFKERAANLGLVLDIESDEDRRIYGYDWLAFLANCRAVLGVEAGVTIFDLNNEMMPRYESIIAKNPDISFDEISKLLLHEYEGKSIYNRMISPRIFEAASVCACQILFEGRYSGVLVPNVHYIPLKKDFSNFDDVIRQFRDPGVRQMLSANAYRDLIKSGVYSYENFINEFDHALLEAGVVQQMDVPGNVEAVTLLIYEHSYRKLLEIAESGEAKYMDTLRRYVGLQYQYGDLYRQYQELRERGLHEVGSANESRVSKIRRSIKYILG
jgi:hypothetical protein